MNLSTEEFKTLRDLIYSYSGMSFNENKIAFLERRIKQRMERLALKSTLDYCRYLSIYRNSDEMEELIKLVATYETYFFRDYPQLKVLAEGVLPILTEKKESCRNGLRVLSAGCSTGDEPYTIAIILKEMLDKPEQKNLRIDAVDISNKVLQKAGQARYGSRSLRDTPHLYRNKYFSQNEYEYTLNEKIRDMVRFSRANIVDREQMLSLGKYDIVMCRNVLIYFDKESSTKVIEHFYEMMNPGAFIFLGAAESVGRLTHLFKMIRLGESFLYRKQSTVNNL